MSKGESKDLNERGVSPSVAPAYHRMNFLLQAGQQYALISNELSRYCFSQAREISRKKLARISSEARRLWCKRCFSHFIPAVTCDLVLEETVSKSGRVVTNIFCKCIYCNWRKRYYYN
ncbi:ribonuclease P protein subunit p21-like [Cryptosporidium felis]|nr:ribonuclease P protein subunit p21-like [Cryptosporidium felis]